VAGGILYLDSSSFLITVLGQTGSADLRSRVAEWESDGGRVASSRLLWLEVRRVVIRERLAGNDFGSAAEDALVRVERIPVTDEVWERAATIEQHVRSLDAIHLATCELIGATLLSAGLDHGMRAVAEARHIGLL
jgi:predicted nucleic acid-binding protein